MPLSVKSSLPPPPPCWWLDRISGRTEDTGGQPELCEIMMCEMGSYEEDVGSILSGSKAGWMRPTISQV